MPTVVGPVHGDDAAADVSDVFDPFGRDGDVGRSLEGVGRRLAQDQHALALEVQHRHRIVAEVADIDLAVPHLHAVRLVQRKDLLRLLAVDHLVEGAAFRLDVGADGIGGDELEPRLVRVGGPERRRAAATGPAFLFEAHPEARRVMARTANTGSPRGALRGGRRRMTWLT